ncbi:Transducin family protein / WD-40 repeat family protein isoform 2 [Hibiscus syriacus]|uniref:Transducin family protein / WD-40 repeat family protein isoform 2 n=1 Tax=Hibiscus syriacus TaxID=106335 RepID=A0A6A2ZXE3_HIBSY|nr:Transducin family protein / WD-40 repeat family protein isoform 2 [Hibiscus syriacus]
MQIVLESIGVSIWQLAVASVLKQPAPDEPRSQHFGNGHLNDEHEYNESDDAENSEDEDASDSEQVHQKQVIDDRRVALACDDGALRLYTISSLDKFMYHKSMPRVSGRALSVTWSHDSTRIYSGSSDGLIRCWNADSGHEIFRSTVALGGLGSGPELCIWSLLSLRCGTVVSADSTGSVQFWNGDNGTLLQAHLNHKGDVNSLAAAPNQNKVFSAGSDGQVILYKLCTEKLQSCDDKSSSEMMKKWVYVGYVRAHSHDVRALTMAMPISSEGSLPDKANDLRDEQRKKVKRIRREKKPLDFSYGKWARFGVPMLVSAGDDAKLFAYSGQEFSRFSPHDIFPAPRRVPMQLVINTSFSQTSFLLVQACYLLDVLCVRVPDVGSGSYGGLATTNLVARVKSKASRKIICSAMSNSGEFFGYSDQIRPRLFALSRQAGQSTWTISKRQLPKDLPSAHSMAFTSDGVRLLIAGHDRMIYVGCRFGELETTAYLCTLSWGGMIRIDHLHSIIRCSCVAALNLGFLAQKPKSSMFGIEMSWNGGNTGLSQDWMAPLLLLVAFLRTEMCLLSQHHQTSSTYLMWKLDDWENGQCSIRSHFPEDTKNFLGRLLGCLSALHHHQNLLRWWFTVPGAVLILAMCSIDFGKPVDKDDQRR